MLDIALESHLGLTSCFLRSRNLRGFKNCSAACDILAVSDVEARPGAGVLTKRLE